MLKEVATLVALLLSATPLTSAQYPQTNGQFIHDNSLGEFYPYAVSLPANQPDTLAPTVLSLAGKGSAFQEGVTFPLASTVSYGCSGWRASRYMNGSRDEADVIVGEQFITITPYVHLFDADANGEYNLTVEGIMAVINDARTKYPIDPNRIYIQGYSAGARAIWAILPLNPNYFAAATVSAGVPQPENFTGLPDMLNVPLRVYVGTDDYDAYSQVWMAEAYENQIEALGGTRSEIVYLQGVNHNDMQQTPYDADMYYWLLNNTNAAATPDQVSVALAPNAEASAVYSSIASYADAYESAYSASLYNDGLPPESRAEVAPPASSMAPLSLAADFVSSVSAAFDGDAPQAAMTSSPSGVPSLAISDNTNQAAQTSSAHSSTLSALLLGFALAAGYLTA